MPFSNPVVGGSTLIRPAIHSPNFVAGLSGWSINKDGSAEFHDLIVRGDGTGDVIIVGPSTGSQVIIGTTPTAGYIDFPTNRPIEDNVSRIIGLPVNVGSANEYAMLQIQGPSVDGATQRLVFNITSQTNDGSREALFWVRLDDGTGTFPTLLQMDKNATILNQTRLALTPIASALSAFFVNIAAGHTGNLLRLQNNGTDAFVVDVNGNTTISGVDQGRGAQATVQITSAVTAIAAGTETVLMTIPSMTYTNGRAYRITLNGLQQSSTASTYFLYRIRKGSATTVGTIYLNQIRVPTLSSANTNSAVNLSFVLENNSGADITTALTWTGNPAAGTGIFDTPADNRAYATVEDIGVVGSYSGVNIT